ncbi:MAG TPA: MarR family transcriptional regulator [Acidimicrobiales bacterium]
MGSELRAAVQTLAQVGRGLERAASPLSLPQYRVLTLIATAPERASRLAQRVDVTKATLTGVMDALESHGWIERTVVEGDRRGVALTLTATGAEVLEGAEQAMCGWLAEVLACARPTAATNVSQAMAELGEALHCHRTEPR